MRWRRCLLAAAAAAAAGCSGNKVEVGGRVVYPDGTPAADLAGSAVTFVPVDGKYGGRGPIDAAGRYSLSSDRPGDGILPGRYKVVVQPGDILQQWRLDAKYQQNGATPLEVEVTGATNDLDLTVSNHPRKPGEKPPQLAN